MDSIQGFLGLRCVTISRCQTGFGFTLRHFIVYPPEVLYSEDVENDGHGRSNGLGQSRLPKVTEPVDTIFVKSVRENSPADHAGLCVGDRIVSVNGEAIVGKSYDQVVSLIQKTRDLLCLEVSPKQYDTLQRFYEEQAYHPETNQRPYEALKGKSSSSEPLYHYPLSTSHYSGSNSIQLHQNDYAYPPVPPHRSYDATDYTRLGNMSSSHSSHSPAFFSHLPRPVPYKSSSVWASPAERNGGRPSVPSSLSQSSKAVQQPRPQPQSYYPFNHSFDKSNIWKVRDEPNSGAKSADSILGESCSTDTAVYRSPLRSESMECLSDINNTNTEIAWEKAGPGYRYSISAAKAAAGTSQPASDFQNTMVVTMSSTNTGHPSRHPRDPLPPADGVMMPANVANSFAGYENIVDRIRRSCEQKEEFLKRPNQPFLGPFSAHQAPPFPKELYAQPQKFTKIPWPPANMPAVTAMKQPLQSSLTDNRNLGRHEKRPNKSNNVTVISVQHSGPASLSSSGGGSSSRPEISTSDSWSPTDRQSESETVQKVNSENSEVPRRDAYNSSSLLSMYELPKNRTTVVGSRKLHCDPPPDWKPDLATLTGYQHQQQLSPVVSPRAEARKEALFLPESSETDLEVQSNTENVILRSKDNLQPGESESERLVRRVSYLKATSSPIDMERKSTSPTSPVKSPLSDGTGTGASKSERPVDSSEVVRDGKVHFKIRMGENKRSTYNRSWRQGFAQVRHSGYLYLSKERLPREGVTGNEESVIISVSIRDGVAIEQAEDYTKRKYVFRLRTSFIPDDESNFPLSVSTDNYQPSSLNSTLVTVELLLQAEDLNDLNHWLTCIQKQLENNNCNNGESISNNFNTKGVYFGSEFYPKSKSFLTSLLPSPGTPAGPSSSPTERSVTATSSTNSSTAPSSSAAAAVAAGVTNTAASPKVKTWKGKVAKQWKKVHDIIDTSTTTTADNKSSSPYASLPVAGATFGINLENCPPGESNPYVPRVIEYSIELVERKGIEMVGLYRIPGNNASVAILTQRLNRGEDPNPEKDPRWLDVHVVASLIKSFLRRLPDPLLTNDRYPAFIQAADEGEDTCMAKIKELIQGLPIHNYETLKAVAMHLKYVAEKGEVNRMDARNLAIVFGPTIVRTAGENFSSMVADMKNQCKIVEALILHADDFFNIPPSKPVPVVLRQLSETQQQPGETPDLHDVSVKPVDIPKPLSPSPTPTMEDELKASLIKAAKRKVSAKENQPLVFDEQKMQLLDPQDAYKPVDEKGFIRSYAGLNDETSRRIRNFELETRAMLYRDDRSPNSSVINVGTNKSIKGIEDIKKEQMKLDDAIRQAKHELETEDIFDQIADNPSILVQHRDRSLGLCASSPGPFTLSNSSLSSSNSNSTAPSSLLTSSLPAWPTGNRLGPVPFRNSMPPQSLPPKPPMANTSFETVPVSAQSQSSIRRVSSFDRLQGSQPSTPDGGVGDAASKFEKVNLGNKDSFRRLRRPDGTLTNPKQLGGSLDSLKDITADNTAMLGKVRLRARTGIEGSREDLSPKSDASDMVATLTKTLDSKLQSLRNQFSGFENDTSLDDQQLGLGLPDGNIKFDTHDAEGEANVGSNKSEDASESSASNHVSGTHSSTKIATPSVPNHFKKGRRRHSLIERRKSSIDFPPKEYSDASNEQSKGENNKVQENHSDGSKVPKSSKKLAKECRRRHSLSGATDILSLVFRGSEKLSVHKDPESKRNKTLSSEALLSALKNASILESHV